MTTYSQACREEGARAVNPMVERTWKCQCGKFQAKLKGEPLFVVNCHCRSCVSCMRHIDAKGDGRNTSAEAANGNGGVAKAFYDMKDVEFTSDNPAEQLAFVKLGDEGKNVRSYTRCCGTQLQTAGGRSFPAAFRPFNRNCITNADGSKYDPDPGRVLNVFKAKAFDPGKVPKPNGGLAAAPILAGFAAKILGYRLFGLGADSALEPEKEQVFRVHGSQVTEIVPITWE
jgi:hypothetical protein